MKITKNNKKLLESIDLEKIYEPIEAIKILKENSFVKFKESLEVAINLSIEIYGHVKISYCMKSSNRI